MHTYIHEMYKILTYIWIRQMSWIKDTYTMYMHRCIHTYRKCVQYAQCIQYMHEMTFDAMIISARCAASRIRTLCICTDAYNTYTKCKQYIQDNIREMSWMKDTYTMYMHRCIRTYTKCKKYIHDNIREMSWMKDTYTMLFARNDLSAQVCIHIRVYLCIQVYIPSLYIYIYTHTHYTLCCLQGTAFLHRYVYIYNIYTYTRYIYIYIYIYVYILSLSLSLLPLLPPPSII